MSGQDTSVSESKEMMSTKTILILTIFIPCFLFILYDVLGLINGGGLFSITSALSAANRHVAVINVDAAGLRTIFILLLIIGIIILITAFRMQMTSKKFPLFIVLPIICGGFIVDVLYDETITEHYLAHSGYKRCQAGDFRVGSGKSRVWFDNYVLIPETCPSGRRPS